MEIKAITLDDKTYPETLWMLGEEAERDRRSGAQMAAILIEEAIAARQAKREAANLKTK